MAAGRKTGGRRPGSPNKVTKALKEMILGALDDAGGQRYLATCAAENPAAFLRLLGQVLPTTIVGDADQPLTIKIVKFGDHAPE
jgi:hypothetical protein